MSPQRPSFVGYIENYGIKFKTLEFVTKDNIYSFGHNKSFSLVIGS